MTYAGYKALFNKRYAGLKLSQGATECGPFLRPTISPDLPPWKLFWCISYPNDRYIRITEYFDVDPMLGRRHGDRAQFGFHYGPISKGRPDKHGCPKPILATDIRFDLSTDEYKDHLHYGGEEHIAQSRVQGVTILEMDPFRFIEGIEFHRTSGNPLHDCFGFMIKDL
jgi:hypothetical protein